MTYEIVKIALDDRKIPNTKNLTVFVDTTVFNCSIHKEQRFFLPRKIE